MTTHLFQRNLGPTITTSKEAFKQRRHSPHHVLLTPNAQTTAAKLWTPNNFTHTMVPRPSTMDMQPVTGPTPTDTAHTFLPEKWPMATSWKRPSSAWTLTTQKIKKFAQRSKPRFLQEKQLLAVPSSSSLSSSAAAAASLVLPSGSAAADLKTLHSKLSWLSTMVTSLMMTSLMLFTIQLLLTTPPTPQLWVSHQWFQACQCSSQWCSQECSQWCSQDTINPCTNDFRKIKVFNTNKFGA